MKVHRSTVLAILLLVLAFLVPAPSAAQVPERDQWVTVTDGFDSCSGETVIVTIDQHILEQVMVDHSGQQHVVSHRNVHGTGIGTVSGATYLLIDAYSISGRTETVIDGTTVSTQVYEMVFVRLGEATANDDTFARWIIRIMTAPDGTQTTETILDAYACR